MTVLTEEQLKVLQSFDTPTICNAIEGFGVRDTVDGFLGMDIRCMFPQLGSMVGYAVTAKLDASTRGASLDRSLVVQSWEAMRDSPVPGILVYQDVGPNPRRNAIFGDGMATLAQSFGLVGIVTNSAVRDIEGVNALGFHCFAAGLVPSHGSFRVLEVGTPVEIDGVEISTGDLLHGDANGVTLIPSAIAEDLADAALGVQKFEDSILKYMRSPEFSIEDYCKLLGW